MIRSLAPLSLLALAACATSSLDGKAPGSDLSDAGVIEGEFIISEDLPEALASEVGLVKVDFDDAMGAGLYTSEDGVSKAALEATLKEKVRDTLRVEHNVAVRATATDTYRDLQWNMDLLQIETAWDYATGSGVTVAVIDTGVSFKGEDKPTKLVAGWDYVNNDGDPSDLNGHGTHVAGTIAQASGNGKGVVGMAPDATILVYRVLDANGSGSVYWSAKAVRAAADAGADVINLSLGAASSTATEADAVAYAIGKGVIVVAASGNEGKTTLDYPAGYPNVVSVGAIGADMKVAPYSNGGTGLDIVAPGGNMELDFDKDGYADGVLQETITGYEFFEGTSMAAPHVAGAAALLLSAGASSSEVYDLLIDNAVDLNQPGWGNLSGYGALDIVASLEALGVAPADDGATSPPASGGSAPATDTTAPVISGVDGTRSGSELSLWWTTNEAATSEIAFDGYGTFGDADTYVTSHELSFTIDPYESYYFTIIATDAAGNTSEDGVWVTSP